MERKHRRKFTLLATIWVWMVTQSSASGPTSSKPHIIFLLADDLGWYDVSWHNPKAITPNMEELANEGIILEQSYVQPLCTPTRSALLSGRYPFTIGRQGPPLMNQVPTGLLLNATILPEAMKAAGYSTHAVGKNGSPWIRFSQNEDPDFSVNGTYDTFVYANYVEDLLYSRDPAVPMFLYLAFQSIHSPMQVPDEYRDPFRYIGDENREISLGMSYAMDDAIGRVVAHLKATGHYENSIIIFSSDNGGAPGNGINWPLRGGKSTLWEGGTRAPGFIHSPLLTKIGFKSQTLLHVTDWYATLVGLAGGSVPENTDGFDQWEALTQDAVSPRTSFVYNLNSGFNSTGLSGAIRKGEYKLLVGVKGGQWIEPPEGFDEHEPINDGGACEISGENETIELYNVIDDPEERNDIAELYPEIVAEMLEDLEREFERLAPVDNPPADLSSDPKFFDGLWSPGWCEPQ